jgi:hypothetical protein
MYWKKCVAFWDNELSKSRVGQKSIIKDQKSQFLAYLRTKKTGFDLLEDHGPKEGQKRKQKYSSKIKILVRPVDS